MAKPYLGRGPPKGGWPKHTFAKASLPNAGSALATPASLAIDLHYANISLHSRWTYERFLRLAAFLNLTPGELGSMACITHSQVEKLDEVNQLMIGVSRNYAGAMLLTLIEAHALRECSSDIIEQPFLNLNSVAPLALNKNP